MWASLTHTRAHTLLSSMAPDLVNDSICGQLITVVWLWLRLSNKATWTRGDPFKPRPLSCEELLFIPLPIRALSPSAFLPSVRFQKGVIRMWPKPSAIHSGSRFPNGDYRVRHPDTRSVRTHTGNFKAFVVIQHPSSLKLKCLRWICYAFFIKTSQCDVDLSYCLRSGFHTSCFYEWMEGRKCPHKQLSKTE